jgi:hypothetical protein
MTEHEALQEAVRQLLSALNPIRAREHSCFGSAHKDRQKAFIKLDKAFWLCVARVKITDKAWGTVTGGNLADRGYFTGVVEDDGEQIPCVNTYRGMGWTLQDVGFHPDDPERAEALLDIAIQEAKSK